LKVMETCARIAVPIVEWLPLAQSGLIIVYATVREQSIWHTRDREAAE